MAPQLLFAVGASGVGKTAAIRALNDRAIPGLECHFFDSVGVPAADEMARKFGSPEGWQEATTHEWVARLRKAECSLALLEGQTRPSFIRAALAGSPAGIVLLDCEPSVRSHRLRVGREQPELDTAQMQNWAAYLRGQADALGLPVIDTSSLSPSQVAAQLYELARSISVWANA